MTGKEFNVLDEIRSDVKSLLSYMSTSTERAKHCTTTFADIRAFQAETKLEFLRVEKLAQWSRGKILFFSGILTVLAWLAGKFL